ncbi:MAG: hypothetical protein H0T73_09225 [Ardenticatenales bacterium]|nr:hypothetical protein [Ardenticatenales bacterium]
MAEKKNRLTDAMQTHILLKCPACGQQYAIYGIMVQDDEEMSCTECNSLFRLRIQGNKVDAYMVSPPTGAPLGPAEGLNRK